jgi:hypothetical protein
MMEITVTMSEPKNAAQKPATWKPLTKLAAQNISALMTKRKKPKVTILNGNVKTFSAKPKVTFNIARTMATKSAVQKPATYIPGTITEASSTPKVVNKIFKRIFIYLRKFCPTSWAGLIIKTDVYN